MLPEQLIVIQPTPFCNIRCRYCYLPDRDSHAKMTDAVFRGILQNLEASPLVRVYEVRALDGVYFKELATPRAAAAMGFAFAAVAIVAAASGLFTVLSYGVSRRRREFGIRTALGSSPAQIRGLVLRDGLTVALAGVAIGSVAAWWLARGLASLEYGVSPADPVTWSIVFGVIGVTTMAACWRPARQATDVDPVMLLREE